MIGRVQIGDLLRALTELGSSWAIDNHPLGREGKVNFALFSNFHNSEEQFFADEEFVVVVVSVDEDN